jgi:hypothetical protein
VCEVLAAEAHDVVVLGKIDRVARADLDAGAAEAALREVEVVLRDGLLLVAFAPEAVEFDAVARAGLGAKRAGGAARASGFGVEQQPDVASRAVMRMPMSRLLKPERVSRMAENRLMGW